MRRGSRRKKRLMGAARKHMKIARRLRRKARRGPRGNGAWIRM